MSYEYRYGDVAHDKSGTELHVRGVYVDKVLLAWIDERGRPMAVNFHKGEPKWADYVLRDGKQVYPVPTPVFGFGDKVRYKNDPDTFGVVVGREDAYYIVAFEGYHGIDPLIEEHKGDKLEAA